MRALVVDDVAAEPTAVRCLIGYVPQALSADGSLTGRLDPVARRAVWRHLTDLSKASGLTLLVTTHSMHEADEQCQRLAVMSGGVVRSEGTPEELRASLDTPGGTLEDVFVALTATATESKGDLRDVNRSRRTTRRLG